MPCTLLKSCALIALPALALLASTQARANCGALVQVGTCTVSVSATALAFGDYNPALGTTRDMTSTITVNATVTGLLVLTRVAYTISLGTGVTGSMADRRMTGGSAGQSLKYNLFTDASHSSNWGTNGVSNSMSAIAILGGVDLTATHTVYGRIPIHQYVSAGTNYTDTITVTVNY